MTVQSKNNASGSEPSTSLSKVATSFHLCSLAHTIYSPNCRHDAFRMEQLETATLTHTQQSLQYATLDYTFDRAVFGFLPKSSPLERGLGNTLDIELIKA